MKKLLYLSIILATLFAGVLPAMAQDKQYAIINIIRNKVKYADGALAEVTFHNQRGFTVGNNSVVKFKTWSKGKIDVTVQTFVGGTNQTQQVRLNVERGKKYYIQIDFTKMFKPKVLEVDKAIADVLAADIDNIVRLEESTELPIDRASLADLGRSEGKGQGTCFLISSGGYVITNYHVIENAKEITVKGIDGDFSTKYGATVVATDPSNDLALLKIGNPNLKFSVPPFMLQMTGVDQAEKVFAMGFPKADAMGSEVKVTEGIISAKSGVHGDISKYQISAVVNPGNSGGPLIDEDGNVIGVIYAKSNIADAAGYAIKASYLDIFLKNVDNFVPPAMANSLKGKTQAEKIAEIRKFIYIVEAS